jgi:hypothetical protein
MEQAIQIEELTTAEKLDRLYALQIERADAAKDIDAQITMLSEERRRRTGSVDIEIERLEGEVKEECMAKGETVKGRFLQVVYTKGKTILDIETFKQAHPALFDTYSKISKASASIRAMVVGK